MPRRPVEDHRRAVAALVAPTAAIARVPVREAHGLVLGEPVDSPVALPAFDNSAMDGFAVHAADVIAGQPLPVVHRIPAGSAASPLPPRTAAAIMTGAPVPDGADAIIPVEESAEAAAAVTFTSTPPLGAFIRRQGSDVGVGDRILAANTQLAPHHLGALAAAGITTVAVHRRPRVAVLSTGSELTPAGQPLGPGQIYESNSTLLAALASANGADVCSVGTVGDDGGFRAALDAACAQADLVLTTGGVSAGEHEPVRDLLSDLDDAWFGAVAVQPGGPQGLAHWRGTPVICLPGNPVSVLVSFEIFVRPALRHLVGVAPVQPIIGRVTEAVTSIPGKTQFLRARVTTPTAADTGATGAPLTRAQVISGPSSHLIATAAQADALVEVAAELTELSRDMEVPIWPLTT